MTVERFNIATGALAALVLAIPPCGGVRAAEPDPARQALFDELDQMARDSGASPQADPEQPAPEPETPKDQPEDDAAAVVPAAEQAEQTETLEPAPEESPTEPIREPAPEPSIEAVPEEPIKDSSTATESTEAPDPEAAQALEDFIGTAREAVIEHEAHHQSPEEHPEQAVHAHQELESPPPTYNKAQARRFTIGLEGHGAASFTRRGEVTAIGLGGVNVGMTIGRVLTLGIGHIGAPARKERSLTLQAGPYAELFFFPWSSLQLYCQAGLPLQVGVGPQSHTATAAAVFAGAGIRLWMGSRFTVSPTLRLYYVADGDFHMGNKILPEGDVALTAGGSVALHF